MHYVKRRWIWITACIHPFGSFTRRNVQWTNNAPDTDHTVTSCTGLFDSGPLSPGSVYTRTFNQAGTYDYHCAIHNSMMAVVKVSA